MTPHTDTHCHLGLIEGPLEPVIFRALRAGVERMVTVGIDLDSDREAVELAAGHEDVFAAVGVHPNDCAGFDTAAERELTKLASRTEVVALGETGLDYYREGSPRQVQEQVFRTHIRLAKQLGKALVIHMRDAHLDVIRVLSDEGPPPRLVFHCFSGGPDEAREALDLGGYLSFAGNISFPKAETLRGAAASAPMDRLLTETDSPFLSPVPYRGEPNEPARVVEVARVLAETRGVSIETVSQATSINAQAVFGL